MDKRITTPGGCLLIAVFTLSLLTGCSDREGKRFGYTGADLGNKDKMFIAIGTVTNYLPARVLMPIERSYVIGEREKAVIKHSALETPGTEIKEIPSGYVVREKEPWFTVYVKEGTSLGIKGTCGIVSHYNEEKKIHSLSETFFSVYVDSPEEAAAVSAKMRQAVERDCMPLKIYSFDGSWVAEYLRMVAVCVVGRRPDGRWTAMFTLRDKLIDPSLVWVSIDEQKEILADYVFSKEMEKWTLASREAHGKNHVAVLAKAAKRGLASVNGLRWMFDGMSNRYFSETVKNLEVPPAATPEEINALVASGIKEAAALFGVEFPSEMEFNTVEGGGPMYGMVEATNDLYMVSCLAKINFDDGSNGKVSQFITTAFDVVQKEVEFPIKPVRVVK